MIKLNALWSHSLADVPLPVSRIFEYVPIAPALVRHWLGSSGTVGGLIFPVQPLDMESKDLRLQIVKHSPIAASVDPLSTLRADIHILVFRRDLSSLSTELQPFDPALWDPVSYERWRFMHSEFATVVEEELNLTGNARFPSDGCALFRRMMRAHFQDFGMLFGRMWVGFGLRELVGEPLHDFMQQMLLMMFLSYHAPDSPPPPLPPCYSAATVDPGQRVCAKCLTFMLGHGRMKRCGRCHQVRGWCDVCLMQDRRADRGLQVYYCSKACQTADWEIHRVVCGAPDGARSS
jgi:ribosomal protein S27AE